MRQALKLVLVIALCLALAGCSGGGAQERAEGLREEYAAAENFDVRVRVTADYGDRVYDYKLRYTGGPEAGETQVLEPETVEGLVIASSAVTGELKLKYDGAELYAGDLTRDGLTPAGAVPVMLDRWREGYIESAIMERLDNEQYLAVTYPISDQVSLVTWFDENTGLPYRAEISENGRMVIACRFGDVAFS